MVEWVEVRARSIELAVEAGLAELGLDDADAAEIEVVQEPSRGFLGMGGQEAIVKIKPKPRRRRRRRGRGKKDASQARSDDRAQATEVEEAKDRRRSDRAPSGSGPAGRDGGRQGRKPRERARRSSGDAPKETKDERRPASKEQRAREESKVTVDINEQAAVVEAFLRGLVDAFGFDGRVEVRVEDDVILASVEGAETEALVGDKGAVMQAILELARTVVQRKTQEGARIRLDIAGYGERRREALQIYARRLAEKVLADGGEIMLEPMNPADRKVVHDAIAEIDGVRTFSEGEEPTRSVVIGPSEE